MAGGTREGLEAFGEEVWGEDEMWRKDFKLKESISVGGDAGVSPDRGVDLGDLDQLSKDFFTGTGGTMASFCIEGWLGSERVERAL